MQSIKSAQLRSTVSKPNVAIPTSVHSGPALNQQQARQAVPQPLPKKESMLSKAVSGLAAAVAAVTVATSVVPSAALAEDVVPATNSGKAIPEAVYFGNGCFWGRQFDFVQTEKQLGRSMDQISSVVGYAGGRYAGPDGKVCYYLSDPRTVYEKLGHAEVVKVDLSADTEAQQQEFRRFADTYFKQFRRMEDGRMQRLDPQDVGAGYRNVIGLPGGVSSPLFDILKEANSNGMELREGRGNEYQDGSRPTEGDEVNVVWVVDSKQLPFFQAERYHQFHNGIGKMFPLKYLLDQKNMAASTGRITGTGCPEFPF